GYPRVFEEAAGERRNYRPDWTACRIRCGGRRSTCKVHHLRNPSGHGWAQGRGTSRVENCGPRPRRFQERSLPPVPNRKEPQELTRSLHFPPIFIVPELPTFPDTACWFWRLSATFPGFLARRGVWGGGSRCLGSILTIMLSVACAVLRPLQKCPSEFVVWWPDCLLTVQNDPTRRLPWSAHSGFW